MNPFDDTGGRFVVLRNDENQHSLWPAAMAVPVGWSVVLEESTGQECLDYIETHWTDIRPLSLLQELR